MTTPWRRSGTAMRPRSSSRACSSGSVSGRLFSTDVGVLSAGFIAAGGTDPARRRVRISAQSRADALDLEFDLRRWVARCGIHARRHGRRPGGRPGARSRSLRWRRNWAGSVPLRCYAASASVSATRSSAPAGLSGNVKARRATSLIASSLFVERAARLPGRRVSLCPKILRS
jgi:hypothetical protein